MDYSHRTWGMDSRILNGLYITVLIGMWFKWRSTVGGMRLFEILRTCLGLLRTSKGLLSEWMPTYDDVPLAHYEVPKTLLGTKSTNETEGEIVLLLESA